MTTRLLNRLIAIGVLVVALTVYMLTLAPTVVFWDVGEFIAAAKMMQVPHPPGSPLFLLLTRLAMMVPFAADQAVRAHALSAVMSALGVMFLYLVIVRVILNFRGVPETVVEKVGVYGGAVIGALSLAFGTTYWDNSIEAEVYGASMFFLSAIMWLVMRWRERWEVEGNEKYLLLIAYLIGLSLGVHLLALLAIFPVLMVVYFRRYEYSLGSFLKFVGVAVVVFWVVYPGIVKYVPGMMDGEFGGQKSEVIKYLPWVIIGAACYGVYRTYQKKQRLAQVALLSVVLIFLGYTTYTSVLIRSNAKPPMNENDPSTLARLTSYLGREQYGEAPLFLPRRWDTMDPAKQGMFTNYSSDINYMLRYQLGHMFARYLLWNYAGSEGDWQDARANLYPFNGVLNGVFKVFSNVQPFGGTAEDSLFCIPLLVGLFGVYYQFKKDWKMGLVFLSMFIILGPVLALYQNQQEPQPRERDYFYVGAFYVFSLWISVGIVGLLDALKQLGKSKTSGNLLSYGFVGLATLAIPVNLVRLEWHSHDRSGNYVAWDYSYNMLQTCEQDGILFTNGDNDTFPLWYLQDVEGVRRDVSIVNLSLINTPWYIRQMKGKQYYPEAKPVPISLTDTQIEHIAPTIWEPRRMRLPVPPDVFAGYGVTDTALVNRGGIDFLMKNTQQYGDVKAIRIQDRLVQDIIFTNHWKRPVYFAVTCSPDSKIGLDEYLWFDGLAMRLEPKKSTGPDEGVNATILETNLFHEPEGFSRTPQYGYKFRKLADPSVYFDENTRRLMLNYRSCFIRLSLYYANATRDTTKSLATLNRMEEIIPRSKVPMGWELTSDIASFYYRLGQVQKFNELAAEIEPICQDLIASGQVNMNTYYNPYRVLLDIYEARHEQDKTLDLLNRLAAMYPNDPGLRKRIQDLQARMQAAQAQTPPSSK
jgi:hypothetical protein